MPLHVPLVVHWIQSRDFVHQPVDPTTKVKRSKRVTLLDAGARLDDVLMIVEQHRRLPITPLSPVGHGWKHAVDCLHKVVTPDLVEGIPEIDLEKTELGLLVLLQNVAKRVRHHLDTSRAPHSKVLPLERRRDLVLASHTETLGYQPAKRVSARQWTNRRSRLLESNGYTTCNKAFQVGRSPPSSKVVHRTRESSREVERLRTSALLQQKRFVAEETCGRARPKRAGPSGQRLP